MNIKVLLIDDEEELICKKLQRNAKDEGIEIVYFCNYEAGFAELNRNFTQYHALVLDAKCWKTQAEQDNDHDPTDDALSEGLRLLGEFENRTAYFLPVVVNTGFSFPESYFSPQINAIKARIFRKGTEPDELWAHLKNIVANSQTYQIERKYADVLVVFEKGYLNEDVKKDLLHLILNMELPSETDVRKNLALLRTIYEAMSSKLAEDTKIRSQPYLIQEFSIKFRNITNAYGSHNNKAKKDASPSRYTTLALTHSLLEMLLWFKNEMK